LTAEVVDISQAQRVPFQLAAVLAILFVIRLGVPATCDDSFLSASFSRKAAIGDVGNEVTHPTPGTGGVLF
jgi:hypothetical protein